MKILRHELLRVGDIILTTTGEPVSALVRGATKSDISHAMLCTDIGSVIDATTEGVHARNIQRILIEDERAVHVLRLKLEPTPAVLRAICQFVRQRIGTAYSKREAVQTVLGGSNVWSRKQFCSRLVAQAFASQGINLVSDPNYCSPNELLNSEHLIEINGCTRAATDEDIALAQSVDLTQQMRDATAALIDAARTRNPNILDLNDINQHLVVHPSDDAFILNVLRESGFLDVWRADVERSPWHYNLDLMEEIQEIETLKLYCRGTVADPGEARNRFAINARAFRELAIEHRLSSFDELAKLHEHLSRLHGMRLHVAAQWLAKHDPAAPPPVQHAPHSEEWFADLDAQDPVKAALTRIALKSAESETACSICGDDPAAAYRLDGNYLPGQMIVSLRLCDECVEIRAGMGEIFVPLGD